MTLGEFFEDMDALRAELLDAKERAANETEQWKRACASDRVLQIRNIIARRELLFLSNV